MQAKMTNRITRIFVLLLGLLPVQYAQAQAPDLAIPARKKSRLTANGAVLAAFALLALTLIPAHHASAQIFDSTNPTFTYSITEDASPNTVRGILSLGSGGNLQTGAFTTQNTPGQYGTFVLIHFVNASNVAVTRTGIITYTLDNGNADVNGLDDGEMLTETFTVNANQTSGAQAGDVTATITINIQGATDDLMPTFGTTTITPQTYTTGTAIPDLTLPIATGGDGTLMYAITETLPGGLTFDDTTRVLSGNPTTGQSATDYTYTVTDSDATNPDTVELTFSIAITTPSDATLTATNPDPLVENTLNGATLEITLTGVTWIDSPSRFNFSIIATGTGFGQSSLISVTSVSRDSDTQATLTLGYGGGDFDANASFSVSIGAAAHSGSDGLSLDGIPITAIVENNDASLSALTLSGGVLLAPPFAADTLAYAATVADTVTDIMVTPTATNDFATIRVLGNAVDSGTASAAITLPVDTTTDITILVSATDGATTQTYTLAVTRLAAPPPDITATPIATGANEVTVIFSAPVNVAASGEANFASSALNKGMATSDERWLFFGVVPTEPTTIEPNADGTAVIITLLRRSGVDILPAPLLSTGSFISLTPKDARTVITAATGPARVIGFSVRLMPPNISFAGDTTGEVTEDGGSAATDTGALTATNPGNMNEFDFLPITDGDGDYGLFSINADGEWDYTLGGNTDNDTAVNALPGADPGQTVIDTFRVNSVAGGRQDIVITITGANDPPVAAIDSPADGAQVEFGSTVTLTGSATDPDSLSDLSYRWSTVPPGQGSFTANVGTSGRWVAPTDDTPPVTIRLLVIDTLFPGVTNSAEITLNPVATPVTFSSDTTGGVTEDDASMNTATGDLTPTTSAGATTVAVQTDQPGTYGTFSVTAPGVWTYTLVDTDPDTDALAAGVEMTDTFRVVATANTAATVDIVITITGANDAPNADAGPDQPAVAPSATVMLDGSASADPDTGDTITYAWTQDSGTDVTLSDAAVARPTFTAPDSAGALVFSLVVSDGDLDSAAATVTIEVVAATANIDGNTAVNHLDGLVMYLSLNPVFMSLRGTERFRNELMGHLRTAAVGTTQELVANAEAWRDAVVAGSDVDGVGGVTHLDGLVIYLSLNPVFESLRSTERFRDELMGHLRTTAVTTTQGLVDNANLLTTP